MAKKTQTVADLEHSLRAKLVSLYEANTSISFPKGDDVEFRRALEARINAGVADIAAAHATDEEGVIAIAQDIRLYKGNAGIENPDSGARAFRVKLQKLIGSFYQLSAAVKAASASGENGGVK